MDAEAVKEVLDDTRPRMAKAVEDLRAKLASVRTGRASVSLLDGVSVLYYGVPTPLNHRRQLRRQPVQ
jgi:ribosome recycling factor